MLMKSHVYSAILLIEAIAISDNNLPEIRPPYEISL